MYEIIKKSEMLSGLHDFVIKAPEIAKTAKAGQFVHILCGEGTFLRRPISICEVFSDAIRIVVAEKGTGTKNLANMQVGDCLDVLGPLGRGFDISKRPDGTVLLIGGGIGIFPLLQLSKDLETDVDTILGFRNKELIVMQDEFPNLHIATDDGSFGTKGLVTDIAEKLISEKKIGSIYACGPTPMLRAVKNLAEKHNLHCQISMEERMGCGVGACLVCVCKTSNGAYAPVCKSGPVFMANEVSFDD